MQVKNAKTSFGSVKYPIVPFSKVKKEAISLAKPTLEDLGIKHDIEFKIKKRHFKGYENDFLCILTLSKANKISDEKKQHFWGKMPKVTVKEAVYVIDAISDPSKLSEIIILAARKADAIFSGKRVKIVKRSSKTQA